MGYGTLGKTRRGAFAAALAGLFALLVATYAWGFPPSDEPDDEGETLACTSGIQHGTSTCLHGWWNNSPRASTGVAFGSTWGVETKCGTWGDVYGRVKIKDYRYGYRVSGSNKKRGYSPFKNVIDIQCCPHKEELCYKDQVEKNDQGKIRLWEDGSYSWIDVSTMEKRQHLCKQLKYRTGVYCRNDLDEDALDGNSYNCGDHYCNTGDCKYHFENSNAYDTCWRGQYGRVNPTYSIDSTDGSSQTCTVTARCLHEPPRHSRRLHLVRRGSCYGKTFDTLSGGGSRAGSPAGFRASGGVWLAMGGDVFDCGEVRLHGRDAAALGPSG